MANNTDKYLREQERKRVQRDKARAKADKVRERSYTQKLKALEKVGAYNPKSETLTRYRKTRINRAYREFEQFLDSERFAFVKLSKQGLKFANQPAMNAVTTKRGMFIEREGYEKIYERKSKTFPGRTEIRKAWKAKTGENKGKMIEDIVPLVPLAETLEDEDERIRKAANAFGPLKKDERLAFIINTGGVLGYSYNTYSSIDQLLRDVKARYKRSDDAMAYLMAHLIIRKTTLTNGNRPARAVDWNREAAPYRPKKRKRKGKHYGSHKGRG